MVGGLGEFLRGGGGGYLGIGMGGEGGGLEEVGIEWSFGGGVEGREEKRLRPGSDDAVIIAIDNRSSRKERGFSAYICTVCNYG